MHPDRRTPVGTDWTQQAVLELCEDAELARRHSRRPDAPVRCDEPDWQAEVDPLLYIWCDACRDDDSEWSAENMLARFHVLSDKWQDLNMLDESELTSIQRDINRAVRDHEVATRGGAFNNSYWVLQDSLEKFTAFWDEHIADKIAARAANESRRREEEDQKEVDMGNRVGEAMETSIIPAGYLAQAEASRAQDDSRHTRRPREPSKTAQFFGFQRRPKKK